MSNSWCLAANPGRGSEREREVAWTVSISSTACVCDSASSAELFSASQARQRKKGNSNTNKLVLYFCSSGPKKAEKSPLSLSDPRQWLRPFLSADFLQITQKTSCYVTWVCKEVGILLIRSTCLVLFFSVAMFTFFFFFLSRKKKKGSKTPAAALKLAGESRRVWLTTQRKNAKATCELWRPFLTLPGSCLWDHSWLMR